MYSAPLEILRNSFHSWSDSYVISRIQDGRDCKYCKINYQFFLTLSELENFYDGFKKQEEQITRDKKGCYLQLESFTLRAIIFNSHLLRE